MAITFLDEEEDIVATAEPQKGKSRITFLDEEEPVETPSAERPKITFLDEGPTPAQPAPPVGTSFFEEVAAIPQAFIQGIDQPTEAMAETATVLGMPALGETLRGAVEGAEGYVPAAQRFMQPQEGEFQIGGFAPQFLPRAIVEQAGQIAGAIATRAAGVAIGGLAGSAVGPKGTVAGAVAGQFLGPALFEMSQIVGPVARERAANQGRETPNGDDLGWAWATAGASGALNAIGARYLPNGDKLAGGLAKRISQAFIGEGIPEGGQAAVQQIGETFLTEQGLDLRPKEIAGEALIGGGAGAAAVGVAAPFTKASTAAETKVVAEQAAPLAPETAQVVSEQANQVISEAQAEETAETPEQRVARLQREAQEAAGDIELEEEGAGLPPVSELPPVKEGFVRLYHGGASATAGEFTPYLDTALGYAQQSKGSVFYVDVPENSEFLRREQYDEQGNITDRGILISRQSQVPNEIAQTAQRAASGFEAEPVTPPVTPTPEASVAPVEPVVPVEEARPPVTPEVVPKAENAVVEAEQKSEQESDTVKVFRGVAEAGALPTGGAFFTDSERDASAYAQLAALRKATEENEDFNDIVSEVMAEEGANDITDLSINTIKSIIEGNNIQVGDISEGAVLRGNIRLGNVLNLESFGSEVGSLPETWNELNELGLVPEKWESLDEDVQEELSDKYRGKAFYSLLEGEVNLNDQFAKGIDTIVFTDQNTEGKGTHRTYLTKAAEQFAQEAAPAAVEPTPVATPVTPEVPAAAEQRTGAFNEFIREELQRQVDEQRGQQVLDAMEQAGESPRAVVEDFYRNIYDNLTPDVRARFDKYVERLGWSVPATMDSSPKSIGMEGAVDLGNDVQALEGIERGFVALARTANDLYTRGPEVTPTPELVAPTPEVREARREPAITPQQDRDYLDAVERGDLDAASKMVEDAAKAAGYTFKGTHYTDERFFKFDVKKIGKHDFGDWGRGFYFASGWGRQMSPEQRKNYPTPAWWPSGLRGEFTLNTFLKINKPFKIHGSNLRGIAWDALEKQGYDGILVVNPLYPPTSDNYIEIVVKNPEQIKSADTVTRDDQGSIIPLSQRFQPEQADIRYARREPSEIKQQYTPKTDEEQKAFDKASSNKVLARNPQLAVAAVRMKNGEITAGEYADLVDALDPFVVKGAEPIPSDDKIKQYIQSDKVGKVGFLDENGNPRLNAGDEYEFRIDINTYNRSTAAGDTVYNITAHESVPETSKRVGEAYAYVGVAKVTNPTFITRAISGKGSAIEIAIGKGKFPLATVKGNYEPITELPNDINDPNIWTEVGYNPIRSSFFVDVRSKKALVGGTEAIMVGSRVFVKNAQLEARPTGITMGERYARRVQMGRAGMETSAVEARLQELGFPTGGIIRVVNQPDADFEGRTIILDGKVTGIELNAAAMRDNATIDRVLNHEFAESANADGALNKLVERLTPKEKKEINDTITRLRYEERARTSEEAARAIETLAEAWKGRGFFTRAVARVEAWASKLGFKLTRRAAEYIAARNLADINSGFKTAYNRFINVKGEAREGRAFITPEENARFLELAKDPEANREELQKMVDEAAKRVGYVSEKMYHGTAGDFTVFDPQKTSTKRTNGDLGDGFYFTPSRKLAENYSEWAAELNDWNFEPRVVEAYLGAKNTYILKDNDTPWNMSVSDRKKWTQSLKSQGYDSLYSPPKKINDLDTAGEFVVFENTQIKSADPVTYDDQGNVIPLEQRFQPTTPDIRYARREVRESRREPEAIPTFTEGTPEAATLKEMAASMAKVDAASEAKGGKPETYKISEIASIWMDSGLGERELQDAIVEYTNLTPANAARVAKAIARQYDIQQGLTEARAQTAEGVSVEAIPEGATVPEEADPKRPKTTLQRVIDAITGVRVPPVKITANEKTLLKEQIKLKAAATREAKKAQQEMAADVVDAIKAMDIRGGLRPKQVSALMKRAALINFASEKSVDRFTNYAEKVIANANHDRDLSEAKLAQKRARELAKSKRVPSNQQDVLNGIADIEVGFLDDPREFAETANYYMRAFKSVVSEDYVVVPDDEMTSYLSVKEDEAGSARSDFDLESITALSEKYGVSVSDVNNIINAQDTEAALAQYANREVFEGLLSEKAKQSLSALKKYDISGMTQSQQAMVSKAIDLDVEALEQQDKVDIVRRIDNILVNGRTNGFQKYVDIAEAQSNARKAARDGTFTDQMAAWINILTGKAIGRDITLVGKKQQKELALTMQSVADTFRNIFGKKQLGKAQRIIGHFDLIKATTAANNDVDSAGEQMEKFYSGQYKKYGKALSAPETIMAEGIAGYLIQSVPFKSEGDSIAQRRRLIQEDIRARRKDGDQEMIEAADMIEEQLAKVDGDNVQEILNNLKSSHPAAYESLIWMKDTLLPQYKEFLKAHDENYNDQTNNYENPNYLPIKYKFVGAIDLMEDSGQYARLDSLTPKQAANTIKRVDYTVLPKRMGTTAQIDYSIRKNVFNSLAEQLRKAHTSSAWTKIDAFLKSKDAPAVFGGKVNVNFMADRLKLLKDSQERRSYEWRGDAKFFDALATISRKFGIGYALGGIYQPFKQVPDQLMTTVANTGRTDLLSSNFGAILFQPKTSGAMNMLSKFSIGRRGDAAMGGTKFVNEVESNYTNLERYFNGGSWAKFKERAQKLNDIWLYALKKSDYTAAAASWMTYYQAKLAQDGIKFTDWNQEAQLVETDAARQEAAAYAESMTDIYQGSSDPTNMATFAQRGKSGYENIFKAIFMPLNSFALQQRSRIMSDGRDAMTKSTDPERRALGGYGLAATLGGMVLFHATRRFFLPVVSGLGAASIYALLGVDPEEPDEEKKAEMAKFRWRQFTSELAANIFVGGFGSLPEAPFIDALNRAAYFGAEQVDSETLYNDKGEKMSYSAWTRNNSPFWRYKEYGSGMNLGMLDITSGQIGEVADVTRKLIDPERYDTLTEDEKRLIYFAALSEWLYTLRLNDTDMNRMIRNMAKETEAMAKEREKEIKRIREGR